MLHGDKGLYSLLVLPWGRLLEMFDLVNRLIETQIIQGLSEKASGWPVGMISALCY